MTVLNSNISWCSGTLGVFVGCNKISAGCERCYAEALINRGFFGHRFEDIQIHLNRLGNIKRMRPHVGADGLLPYLCFVNSLSDWAHEKVPETALHQCFDAFEANPHVVFQLLTKRIVHARKLLVDRYRMGGIPANFWIGVSVESNDVAKRLDILRSIRDRTGGEATYFASVEPIVGPTDRLDFTGIDWSIHGGESGIKARVMQPGWLLPGIDNAKRAGAAIWLKQHGQIRSNPMLHLAPSDLGIKAQYQWLIDRGLEKLPFEKGGATLEGGVTYREFPPGYELIRGRLNAPRSEGELFA